MSILFCIMALALCSSASAITFHATGTLDTVNDPDGVVPGLSVGDAFTLDFTYDLSTLDTDPAFGKGQYNHFAPWDPNGMVFNSGSFTTTTPTQITGYQSGQLNVVVRNNTGGVDSLFIAIGGGISGITNLASPDDFVEFYLQLQDNSQTALSSEALPTTFNVANWSTLKRITIGDPFGSFLGIQGTINNIQVATSNSGAPEPSTLTLAALGFLVLLKRRRRKG